MRVRIGGAWPEITSGFARIDGAWHQLTEARGYIAGAWRTIATFTPDLSLAIDPPIGVFGRRTGAGTVTTTTATAQPDGGRAPYTYSWTRIVGNASSASTPASASTNFSRFMPPGESTSEDWRCTVTDSLGAVASADITATFQSLDSGSSGEFES